MAAWVVQNKTSNNDHIRCHEVVLWILASLIAPNQTKDGNYPLRKYDPFARPGGRSGWPRRSGRPGGLGDRAGERSGRLSGRRGRPAGRAERPAGRAEQPARRMERPDGRAEWPGGQAGRAAGRAA
eukprot:gene21272-biopygen14676